MLLDRIFLPLILLWCLLSATMLKAGKQSDAWQTGLVLTDSTNLLGPDEVMALPDSAFTHPGPHRQLSTRFATWVRFNLSSADSDTAYLYLHGIADSVEVWHEGRLIGLAGRNVAYGKRLGVEDHKGLRLSPDGGTYLMKLTETVTAFKRDFISNTKIPLFSNRADYLNHAKAYKLSAYHNSQRLFLLLVFVVLIMIVLSYGILQDAAFGWYALYVAAIFLFYLLRRTYIFENDFFFVRSGTKYVFEPLWISVIVLTYARFVRSFLGLSLNSESPRLFIYLRLIERLCFGLIALTILLLLAAGIYWANTLGIFTRFVLAGMALYAIFLILRRKDRFSGIIGFGISLLITGMMLVMVNDYLEDHYNFNIEPGMLSFFQYAVLAELFVYWVGLLYRWYDQRLVAENKVVELESLREELRLREEALANEWLIISTPRKTYRWRERRCRVL